MADNLGYTPGAGAQVATDDIGGIQYQRIKLCYGGDGFAIDVATANPLPAILYNASLAVTGTFWQATQPVSIASMPSTPVTGTFWQVTQPVSIASMPTTTVADGGGSITVDAPVANPAYVRLSDGASAISTLPVSGTFWQATQPVSIAATVNVAQSGTWNVGTLTSITNAVTVTPPTLTKATQGSTGFSVQDLKDAGRTTLAMTAEFTFAQTAETLLTMTLSQNGAATSTFTSRTITSGKRFRVQSAIIQVELLGSGTAPQRAYLRLRANTAGATTASSPLQWILPIGASTAIVKSSNWASLELPDGFELAGDGTATFGLTLETPDWVTTTATGRAKITLIGFEY